MKKILLAEDDLFISDLYGGTLAKAGYEVAKTTDGAEVLDLLESFCPDVLLLDLMLPNQHGFEILEAVRQHKTCKDVAVIILTNETGDEVESRAKELQAQYFVKALMDVNDIVPAVETALQSKP